MKNPVRHPSADIPLIIWPCYEPAGGRVQFGADLTQHVLLVGSTGCGKTTLLMSAIDQLVAHQARSREDKIGLLVLDAKGDTLGTHLHQAARRVGREEDVLVFGPQGNCALDLFGGLSTEDINRVTRTVMLGTEKFGADNAFWWQSSAGMLTAAFTLLKASGTLPDFAGTVDFLRRWFLSPATPPFLLDLVRRLDSELGPADPMLAAAMDQVQLWQALDSRTKSNLQSCLLNVLQPLLSPGAGRCFGAHDVPARNPAQAVSEGKLCVVSINAPSEPELARFLFKVAKQSFLDAVQKRRLPARLCGLIADEFPLVVTREDIETLATVRSRHCFIVAATQGLQGLSEKIGNGPMHALINNFNTVLFMRCREADTAVQAFVSLGMRQEIIRPRSKDDGGWLGLMPARSPEPVQREVAICPMGALAQLSPHQAFILHADGRRTESPVWFVPWFEANERQPATPQVPKSSAAYMEQLLIKARFKLRWPPQMVLQATAFSRRRRRKTLQKVRAFFLEKCSNVPEGLDSLPDCWLAALPGILWRCRQPHWTKLPHFISRVSVAQGLLLFDFAQELREADGRISSFDRIRLQVNASIYPSRVRPLSAWHRAKLNHFHPEVRTFLESSGQDIGCS